jgi:hypothetical protein
MNGNLSCGSDQSFEIPDLPFGCVSHAFPTRATDKEETPVLPQSRPRNRPGHKMQQSPAVLALCTAKAGKLLGVCLRTRSTGGSAPGSEITYSEFETLSCEAIRTTTRVALLKGAQAPERSVEWHPPITATQARIKKLNLCTKAIIPPQE